MTAEKRYCWPKFHKQHGAILASGGGQKSGGNLIMKMRFHRELLRRGRTLIDFAFWPRRQTAVSCGGVRGYPEDSSAITYACRSLAGLAIT